MCFALGRLNGPAAFVHQCRDPVELLDDAVLFVEGREVDAIAKHLLRMNTLPAVAHPLAADSNLPPHIRALEHPKQVAREQTVVIDVKRGILVRDEDAVHVLGNNGIRPLEREKAAVYELVFSHLV
ncbi:hypothetical protein G6M70_16735 [Agrobacterium tumefaciens]|uniref:hypothetical protein n=1 Tax=Agrobacterium tumefaciens TaxID=358 RepID=UPI001DE41261|nr:hypothetical protein [Agrobacterium tumefaciens]NSY99598.1 hypothetical protein [Agrobacterium tumefaciens]NSZ36351.1 hypothetical protein [Agrobacterium tumefaciens]NTB21867.1 hypothetical protein [Agrobacterium tumefaciens]NTB31787.1 hypothetical protein [Agrobacterium tumefaciens]NTB32154.1 hypothetical protein [Agrobacterium tumefaciens]